MALIASGHIDPDGVWVDEKATNPVISIRAIDADGRSNTFQLIQSIELAVTGKAKVLSMSWGSDQRSLFLEEALDAASDSGVLISGEAGKEPTGEPVYPAAHDSVMAVGAVNPDGSLWGNSNQGNFVSVYAPGFALLPIGYDGKPGNYAGTSIATAYAAHRALIALSQNPNATKEEILKMLSETAEASRLEEQNSQN